jgi:uncharacterized GH25 family protein
VLRFWPIALLLVFASPASAHDFWLQPTRFEIAPGAADNMTIQVGHAQFRTRWSGNLERVVQFGEVAAKDRQDLRPMLQPTPERDAALTFAKPGVEVLVFQSNHANSILPSIRFNDYLKAEGLTPAIDLRTRTGAMDSPGREIYSRCAKALVLVGSADPKSQPQVTQAVGLPLEIVPLRNPYALGIGEQLPVQVLYQGHPLAGATVMLTNLEFDGQPLETKLSDRDGRAAFVVPRVGTWLVNVLWTQPIQNNPDADFDTTFSSLTFGY